MASCLALPVFKEKMEHMAACFHNSGLSALQKMEHTASKLEYSWILSFQNEIVILAWVHQYKVLLNND